MDGCQEPESTITPRPPPPSPGSFSPERGRAGAVLLGGVASTICAAGALPFAFGDGLRGWTHRAEDPAPARPAGGYRDAGVAETEPAAEAEAAEPEAGAVRQMALGALWALGGPAVTLASLAAGSLDHRQGADFAPS